MRNCQSNAQIVTLHIEAGETSKQICVHMYSLKIDK